MKAPNQQWLFNTMVRFQWFSCKTLKGIATQGLMYLLLQYSSYNPPILWRLATPLHKPKPIWTSICDGFVDPQYVIL